MVRTDDGFNYYADVLVYVDDVMVIYHDADNMIRRIDLYFNLKPSSIGDPDIYLESKLKKMRFENGVRAWENSPAKYVKKSVAKFEKYLAELADARWQLPKKKYEKPFVGDSTPDMEETPAL